MAAVQFSASLVASLGAAPTAEVDKPASDLGPPPEPVGLDAASILRAAGMKAEDAERLAVLIGEAAADYREKAPPPSRRLTFQEQRAILNGQRLVDGPD